MAEHGAHLTSTVENDQRLNIFEVLAQQSLMSTVRPAFKHALRVFTEKYPQQLGKLYQYYDEIYLVLDTLIEAYYLKKYGGSFAENFYEMKRVPSGQPEAASLKVKLRLQSLLCLTLLPYVFQKLESFFEELKYKHGNTSSKLAFLKKTLTVKQRLVYFYLSVYPYVHTTWEALSLIYMLAYMLQRSRWHHPSMHLSGTELSRLNSDDMPWSTLKSQIPWSQLSFPGKLAQLTTWLTNSTAMCLSTSLSVGIFFLQFLEWWYESDSSAPSLTALPVPSPPKTTNLHGVRPNVCPLCMQLRTNSTALSVSGYVFCFPCIMSHIGQKHCCPVTGYPANEDHLIKLYEDDT
ncbi:peroxisome assembly protein 12 [Biomphalaria pfeifferi]|uniref:Peroxisome assembly protein 12 n=1 Tax=Biomphalaria pfeifferi TaxID=112525 RepID=A0AAD8BIY8_BIOPF|nr:peroxisome assembly protein 12 [Biomphalaria pfeifferi]